MLRDLTIQNYRCFKDFHIDGLARVNLIVGQNNSGKTTFLEAIYLLQQQHIKAVFDVLNNRGEKSHITIQSAASSQSVNRIKYQFEHIFYGHQITSNRSICIQSQHEEELSIQIQANPKNEQILIPPDEELGTQVLVWELIVYYNQNARVEISLLRDATIAKLFSGSQLTEINNYRPPLETTKNNFNLIKTTEIAFNELAVFWDAITLTPKEESVVAALQILEPEVERISFTSNPSTDSGILIKMKGQNHPLPLGSMGDGMRRILSIAMATVSSENGFLLVDEIDTGLYYQTQTDMWKLIFETAKRLNVQVFATTHSWDCIAAFQEALEQSEYSSVGKLFRLSRRGEDIRAVEYTPDELSVAVRQSIEVR
ncbi:MAG: AAA family ATPase [Oscillatoriaceae cyanobacterium Prado104]|jgi:AAA15 family ATPase/GTPase|nr:AAA family ATPase [Oscillatoriaceae cyanobacterium Prado104]